MDENDEVRGAVEFGVTELATYLKIPVIGGILNARAMRKLRAEIEYLRIRFHALMARGLITKTYLESPEFAFRLNEIVTRQTRTAQEEKRRYLSNALLNTASRVVREDDATLLLGLVESLSLRHMAILKYLTDHSDLKAAGNMSWSPNQLKRSVVRDAVGGIVAVFHFPSLVLDLQGRGLICPPESYSSTGDEDDVLAPLPLAHELVRFVSEP